MWFVGLQAAAQCYIDLIIKESDNNVKLIVLDRLVELKEHPTHERVLQVHKKYKIQFVLLALLSGVMSGIEKYVILNNTG